MEKLRLFKRGRFQIGKEVGVVRGIQFVLFIQGVGNVSFYIGRIDVVDAVFMFRFDEYSYFDVL